jgi:hypothetical protein
VSGKGAFSLLVVFLALFAYLYFVELPQQGKKELDSETKLFSFTEFDITEITITGDGTRVVLQQIDGHPDTPWKLLSPIETVADEGVASAFASQLTHLKSIRKVSEGGSDLAGFGLSPPAYSIRLVLKGGNNDLLEIGADQPLGQSVYVKLGNTVHLVSKGMESYLQKKTQEWRRQELFHFFPADVTSVQLTREKEGEGRLTQSGEDWTLGEGEKGDTGKVSIFLGGLSSLRGEEFIDEGKEETLAKLGTPFFKIRLGIGTGHQEASFYKGGDLPGPIYAVTTPTAPIIILSAQSFDPIYKSIDSFRPETKTPSPPPVAP